MGFVKEEKVTRLIRAIKTIFFLITLLISFLFFSAPVLLAVADTILPSALLSASLSSSPFLSPQTLSSHFRNYDFRYSLIDIPLISILRSLLIICKFKSDRSPSLVLVVFAFIELGDDFYYTACRCVQLLRWTEAVAWALLVGGDDEFSGVASVRLVEGTIRLRRRRTRWKRVCEIDGGGALRLFFSFGRRTRGSRL